MKITKIVGYDERGQEVAMVVPADAHPTHRRFEGHFCVNETIELISATAEDSFVELVHIANRHEAVPVVAEPIGMTKISQGVYSSESKPRRVDDARVKEIMSNVFKPVENQPHIECRECTHMHRPGQCLFIRNDGSQCNCTEMGQDDKHESIEAYRKTVWPSCNVCGLKHTAGSPCPTPEYKAECKAAVVGGQPPKGTCNNTHHKLFHPRANDCKSWVAIPKEFQPQPETPRPEMGNCAGCGAPEKHWIHIGEFYPPYHPFKAASGTESAPQYGLSNELRNELLQDAAIAAQQYDEGKLPPRFFVSLTNKLLKLKPQPSSLTQAGLPCTNCGKPMTPMFTCNPCIDEIARRVTAEIKAESPLPEAEKGISVYAAYDLLGKKKEKKFREFRVRIGTEDMPLSFGFLRISELPELERLLKLAASGTETCSKCKDLELTLGSEYLKRGEIVDDFNRLQAQVNLASGPKSVPVVVELCTILGCPNPRWPNKPWCVQHLNPSLSQIASETPLRLAVEQILADILRVTAPRISSENILIGRLKEALAKPSPLTPAGPLIFCLKEIARRGDCKCTHKDENCCAAVGEYCDKCWAAAALVGTIKMTAQEKLALADELSREAAAMLAAQSLSEGK